MKQYLNDNIVFYFDIGEDELFKRYSDRGDEFQDWFTVLKASRVYREYSLRFSYHRNFWIVKASDTPERIGERICSALDMYKDFLLKPEHQIGTAMTALENFGSDFNGTKEFINYKMDLVTINVLKQIIINY